MIAAAPAASAGAQPRRAALMAYALDPQDQAWLLASLPPVRRVALEELLSELRDLGIPRDVALLDALRVPAAPPASAIASASASASADARGSLSQDLNRTELRWLAGVLRDEPPALTARLLAIRPWPWRHALLAAMDSGFADSVRRCGAPAAAPALDAALCDTLARALASADAAAPRFHPRRLWSHVVVAAAWARRRS